MEAAYRDMVMSQAHPLLLMLNVGSGYYTLKLIPIPEVPTGNGGGGVSQCVCVCLSSP